MTDLKKIKERDLQNQILKIAKLGGWDYYHTHDSRRSPAGWPDLVLCRPPEIIFAELKTQKGRLTAAQKHWLDMLLACGQETYVWRPEHWWNGDVASRLVSTAK